MTDDNLNTAIERLFDALEDLNHVRGRREALEELDVDEKISRVREADSLSEIYEPGDEDQLRMALQHIETARERVIEEIETTTPHSRDSNSEDNLDT